MNELQHNDAEFLEVLRMLVTDEIDCSTFIDDPCFADGRTVFTRLLHCELPQIPDAELLLKKGANIYAADAVIALFCCVCIYIVLVLFVCVGWPRPRHLDGCKRLLLDKLPRWAVFFLPFSSSLTLFHSLLYLPSQLSEGQRG